MLPIKKNNSESSSERVDIVMATYNGESYIAEQLESIIKQTYTNWNLIIRDDGSKDKTKEILKQFSLKDNRIFIVEDNEGNLGFNKNFLTLLSKTSANYISICDQDDVWLPEKVSLSLEKIKEIENLGNTPALVHCDAMIVDGNLNVMADRWIGSRGNISGVDGLVFANSVQGAAAMINASLKKIALSLSPEIPYDYHLALLALFRGRRFYIDQPLLKYRQHDKNVIGALDSNTKLGIKHYSKQLLDIFRSMRLNLKFSELTSSLQFGLLAYKQIKSKYALQSTVAENTKKLENYFYLFEGNNRFVKIFIFLSGSYAFSRKKDYLTFLLLLFIGKDLKNPQSWQ